MVGYSMQGCYKLNGYPQGYKTDRRVAANSQHYTEEQGNDDRQWQNDVHLIKSFGERNQRVPENN